MASESPKLPSAGDIIDGKYVIERVLGKGGMGTVYAARHRKLGHGVAIKVMLADAANHEAAERFVNEGRAAANIQNEHVVRVSDVDEENGYAFMVLELLEGEDLSNTLERERRLPAHVAISLVLQALDGVKHAHARGIVHRDLKPSNLFLAKRPDGSRVVKVLDFGISKASPNALLGQAPARLTSTMAMLGSPLYMSPEQLRSSKHVDARADIWAIGVILFELVTGTLPFMGENIGELFAAILETDPPPLRSRAPDAPAALETIVARCLQRRPEHRYASVADLERDLSTIGSGGALAAEHFQGASASGATAVLVGSQGSQAPLGSHGSHGPHGSQRPQDPGLHAYASSPPLGSYPAIPYAPPSGASSGELVGTGGGGRAPQLAQSGNDPFVRGGTAPLGAVTPRPAVRHPGTPSPWQTDFGPAKRNARVWIVAAFAAVITVVAGAGFAVWRNRADHARGSDVPSSADSSKVAASNAPLSTASAWQSSPSITSGAALGTSGGVPNAAGASTSTNANGAANAPSGSAASASSSAFPHANGAPSAAMHAGASHAGASPNGATGAGGVAPRRPSSVAPRADGARHEPGSTVVTPPRAEAPRVDPPRPEATKPVAPPSRTPAGPTDPTQTSR